MNIAPQRAQPLGALPEGADGAGAAENGAAAGAPADSSHAHDHEDISEVFIHQVGTSYLFSSEKAPLTIYKVLNPPSIADDDVFYIQIYWRKLCRILMFDMQKLSNYEH